MLDIRESAEIVEETGAGKQKAQNRKQRRTGAKGGGKARAEALEVPRIMSRDGDPFDSCEWEQRVTSITGDDGEAVFEQKDVEVPKQWSVLAANVAASKYFYGGLDTGDRENSIRQLINRVSRTISDWGASAGYFKSANDAENFYNELSYACLNQYGLFNSPVWFNVGLYHIYGRSSPSRSSFAWDEEKGQISSVEDAYKHPQSSACFIQGVEDTMEDIMRLAGYEAMLFKYGSGTGTDLSTLRSSREKLSGGGTPSGPLSFMRVFDQIAGVIKSGGKTRRAAKMQSLKVTHPDIEDFISCKTREEKKAWALIEQGYDGTFGGEAYESVMYQNANTSVRLTDEFMHAVENDGVFETKAVKTGETIDTLKAREIMRKIAEGTHICGDPGVQYDTTINRWHTCSNSGSINASNPCSEFMFVDDSACNLASVNLMKFVDESGYFDVDLFEHVVRLFIIAQDIIVDGSSYPTKQIAENSHQFRPLGLGYANLGALIMRMGLPYDDDEGRALAASITALMSGAAYSVSQEMAQVKGAFDEYEKNREPMHEVIRMHHDALNEIDSGLCPPYLLRRGREVWDEVLGTCEKTGFRNSQVTLLAPTGTIGFVMDCDTTGVEPDIALIKYKQLAGGGMLKIVNKTVRPALARLGYTDDQIEAIVKYIDEHETIEGAPHLKSEHLKVFDCAFKPRNGQRYIEYKAHLRMMGAVQPFLSGAISKTVNMPHDASVNDIMQTYIDGWKMGLKAVAIYRDGSKKTQPMNVGRDEKEEVSEASVTPTPLRRRLPLTRQSITHKFEVAGHEGYLTVGMYEDGGPGEVFITMAKEGSTVGGTMDAFGTAISLCLQYGVPVQELCQKFAHSRFEPSGFTKNPDIPIAKSIVDYIFRWLDATFPGGKAHRVLPPASSEDSEGEENQVPEKDGQAPLMTAAMIEQEQQRVDGQFEHFMEDAPTCDVCGAITVRNGACYRCYNCGNSMGCS